MRTILLFCVFSIFTLSTAVAQTGPQIPCVGCDTSGPVPYPETGMWHNPDQSPGSGFKLEIQNGVLLGYIYTYTGLGQPEWLLLNGELQRSETPGVMWELAGRLTRVEGGSCLNCEYQAPGSISNGMQFQLEFMQRNHLRIRVGNEFDQYFVPFTYGSEAKAYFSSITPYLLPKFGPDRAEFIFSARPGPESVSVLSRRSEHVEITSTTATGGGANRMVEYPFRFYDPYGPIPSPMPPPTYVRCIVENNGTEPVCSIEYRSVVYRMPIANFNSSGFYAVSDDGAVLEAIRLNYH